MKKWEVVLGPAIVLFLAGCGGGRQETGSESSAQAPVVDPATAGSIAGKVKYAGGPVRMPVLDMSATPACARLHRIAPMSEQVVVNDNNTLRWTFVWVKSGLPEGRWPVPAEPAVLDQEGCIYRPHVLGVMIGQDLRILNSDTANHSVHPVPKINPEWNESQPPKGDPKVKQFGREEIMIPVKCNVHPWMRAYVGVVSHPFFAVTGTDGMFAIRGLPPGHYTLAAWHEKFGQVEKALSLGLAENRTVEFTFGGPD